MYEKIQPLLENLHRNFIETRNNISEQSRVGKAVQRGCRKAIPDPSSVLWRWLPVPGSSLDMDPGAPQCPASGSHGCTLSVLVCLHHLPAATTLYLWS